MNVHQSLRNVDYCRNACIHADTYFYYLNQLREKVEKPKKVDTDTLGPGNNSIFKLVCPNFIDNIWTSSRTLWTLYGLQ